LSDRQPSREAEKVARLAGHPHIHYFGRRWRQPGSRLGLRLLRLGWRRRGWRRRLLLGQARGEGGNEKETETEQARSRIRHVRLIKSEWPANAGRDPNNCPQDVASVSPNPFGCWLLFYFASKRAPGAWVPVSFHCGRHGTGV